MVKSLIDSDIKLMRARYDEALQLQGIAVKYQWPNIPGTNNQAESLIDSYSSIHDTHIFFEGNPKAKTFKRYGWVVENDKDLPFIIHCSFNLPHLQKDSIFRISGQYADMPERVFRVKELTYDLQAPDHIICQVLPVYDDNNISGQTKVEVSKKYDKSNTFLKPKTDYRGDYHRTKENDERR